MSTPLAGSTPSSNTLDYAFKGHWAYAERVTNDSVTSGTTERVWLSTPALDLLANSTYIVCVELLWTGSTVNDSYVIRLRDTNISGTIRRTAVAPPVATAGGGPYSLRCRYRLTTTTAVTGMVWAATIARLIGTGTGQALIGSSIDVFRHRGSLATA